MQAAARGLAITKLVLYEPPLIADGERPGPPEDLAARLTELIAAGRRGDAVELFQTKGVGIPADVVAQIRQASFWPALEAMAHTLVYETKILGDMSVPTELASSVMIPTLVMAGGESPAWMRHASQAIASVLPDAQYQTLEGQTHDIVPAAIAPVLEEFFAAP